MANTTTPDTGPGVTPAPETPQAAVRPQEAPAAPRSANTPQSTPEAATGPVQPREDAQMDHTEAADRPWTPDRANADGSTTLVLKRACNGCDQYLGDVINRDVGDHGQLTDVRDECPNCRPLVEAEAAGCKTWQVTERSISRVDFELDRLDVYAKGYWEDVDGKLRVVGLRVGTGEARVVARFGDWLIMHPDSSFTVHPAPAAVTA